jgi:hypothetical protein
LCWGGGFQEPWQLLQAWGIQACEQQEPWGLLAGASFQECSIVAAACMGNQAYWPVPSVTHGTVGALGPAYTGVLVSLHFRVKVAGNVVGGNVEP